MYSPFGLLIIFAVLSVPCFWYYTAQKNSDQVRVLTASLLETVPGKLQQLRDLPDWPETRLARNYGSTLLELCHLWHGVQVADLLFQASTILQNLQDAQREFLRSLADLKRREAQDQDIPDVVVGGWNDATSR